MEEENKFDYKQFIGLALIALIAVYWYNSTKPTEEEIAAAEAEKAKMEQVVKQDSITAATNATKETILNLSDSTQVAQYKSSLGAFGYNADKVSADKVTTLENQLLSLKISNKGGQIVEARVKGQMVKGEFEPLVTYDSLPVYLVKDGNASFGLNLTTTDNRVINTKDLAFEPNYSENGDSKVLSMKLKVAADKYLEYRYEIKDDYMVDFSVRSQGLNGVINASQPINMEWKLKSFRHAKSVTYENRYTDLHYEYDDGKDSYLGQATDEEKINDVTWLGYKQHFFTSILLTDDPFKTATISTENIVDSEMPEKDVEFLKNFGATIPLELKGGELNYTMDLYHGPTDYDILSKYDRNLDEIVPLGWGIFGWINRFFLIPLFGLLSSFLPAGIAIIVMTILVRLLLSPITYKSYLSQAKMKVIRPEINEINEKYKDDAMKKQQETMKLYGKAGVSPMAGCIPALMQIPVFYALFMFFPSAFELRQKSFLWAEDLSSYDTIAQLPFNIPVYGDHISLFPILASIAIFFYMRMTTGQQMSSMQQPTQEGMPDMSKMMKYMMYFSPLMMLFFFNNYASGLSLYYFVSNLITIGIMLVIKNYIIDNDKIHAQIEENKKKPKKQNRFQKKMQQMMEQAEAQKKANSKK
ncbi:membrane protein insertase YidC [Kordia algicida OT-1]|uniref:Membrane protein insertase YidC n=1 Tax=Kordia algicida OT-1 TaxID=391587 RepID=A9E2P9_9FLAO|nr:membrane protein insertase YidC [Kordia algicida]EDP95416.1 putative inner membrane protein translocase component YidC [Kordia algicida OT-1]